MTRCGQAGTASAAGDALAVLGALHQQMPGRWPLVAGLSPGQLAARLSRCGLLAVLAARRGQHEFAGDITRWQAPP